MIGKHEGVSFYTVGQHKGLGVGGVQGLDDAPFFVVGKDMKTNCLYVAQEAGNRIRYSVSCNLLSFNWIGPSNWTDFKNCNCKFRYRQKDLPVHLEVNDDGTQAVLTYPSYEYIAPGQIACLYSDDGICLGGGIIDKVQREDKNLGFKI